MFPPTYWSHWNYTVCWQCVYRTKKWVGKIWFYKTTYMANFCDSRIYLFFKMSYFHFLKPKALLKIVSQVTMWDGRQLCKWANLFCIHLYLWLAKWRAPALLVLGSFIFTPLLYQRNSKWHEIEYLKLVYVHQPLPLELIFSFIAY